ncbi:MAG: hypothetical protein EB060_03790 [Proteobacteria bacterium]|nr:hypothetical protein [Pseudomonadota bacterium]
MGIRKSFSQFFHPPVREHAEFIRVRIHPPGSEEPIFTTVEIQVRLNQPNERAQGSEYKNAVFVRAGLQNVDAAHRPISGNDELHNRADTPDLRKTALAADVISILGAKLEALGYQIAFVMPDQASINSGVAPFSQNQMLLTHPRALYADEAFTQVVGVLRAIENEASRTPIATQHIIGEAFYRTDHARRIAMHPDHETSLTNRIAGDLMRFDMEGSTLRDLTERLILVFEAQGRPQIVDPGVQVERYQDGGQLGRAVYNLFEEHPILKDHPDRPEMERISTSAIADFLTIVRFPQVGRR